MRQVVSFECPCHICFYYSTQMVISADFATNAGGGEIGRAAPTGHPAVLAGIARKRGLGLRTVCSGETRDRANGHVRGTRGCKLIRFNF